MERNQIIGFTLISAILIGYMFWQEKFAPEPVPVQQEQQSTQNTPTKSDASNDTNTTTSVDTTNQNIAPETKTIETDVMKITFSNSVSSNASSLPKVACQRWTEIRSLTSRGRRNI